MSRETMKRIDRIKARITRSIKMRHDMPHRRSWIRADIKLIRLIQKAHA